MEVVEDEQKMLLLVRRWSESTEAWMVFYFGSNHGSMPVPISEGRWIKALDSAEKLWQGSGSRLTPEIESQGEVILARPPHSAMVLTRERSDI